jgi:hypothetical protein
MVFAPWPKRDPSTLEQPNTLETQRIVAFNQPRPCSSKARIQVEKFHPEQSVSKCEALILLNFPKKRLVQSASSGLIVDKQETWLCLLWCERAIPSACTSPAPLLYRDPESD